MPVNSEQMSVRLLGFIAMELTYRGAMNKVRSRTGISRSTLSKLAQISPEDIEMRNRIDLIMMFRILEALGFEIGPTIVAASTTENPDDLRVLARQTWAPTDERYRMLSNAALR